MWWSRIAPLLLSAGLAAGLGGCLRPLYGPTASGVPVQQSMAAIEIATVNTSQGQERLGHYLRSELIFELDGSGKPAPKRYRLVIDAAEAVQATSTDTLTGRADVALLSVSAKYTLTSLDRTQTVTTGSARTTATYFRDPQRFASVRAARDAEIRAAKVLADEIKQRIAAVFASSP